MTPKNSTRCWLAAGTANARNSTAKMKRLSTLSAFSIRYAAKYSWPAPPPCVAAMTSPKAIPAPTHAALTSTARDSPDPRLLASRSW